MAAPDLHIVGPPANNAPNNDTCFGPAFYGSKSRFVQWPICMNLRLRKLGLNADTIAVLMELIAGWAPKDDPADRFIVWRSNADIAERLGLSNGNWVGRVLRQLCEPVECVRPALLTVIQPATAHRAARYSIEPLWAAVAAVDVSKQFPNQPRPTKEEI